MIDIFAVGFDGEVAEIEFLSCLLGSVAGTTIYVRMAVTATGIPGGNINLSSTGAPDKTKAVSGTVNDVPTITLGSISSVSTTATSFSIPYTTTTNNPTRYSISVGTPTAMPSFVVVNNRSLPASPISVTIPASAVNTYHFNLTVRNSTTGCVSTAVTVALVVSASAAPTISTFSPAAVCVGGTVVITGTDFTGATAVSITITQTANCDAQSFITVLPEKPAICPGASVTLTAAGCSGTVTWTGGPTPQNGASVGVSPAATTTYTVDCSTGGSTTVKVIVATPNISITTDVETGKEKVKAIQTIVSDKKVGIPTFTPGANVIYEAGNSITLLPGFTAEKWSIFKAEIKGCN